MKDVLEQALQELKKLEETHQVEIVAKGGAYGMARLIIRDKESKEEREVE